MCVGLIDFASLFGYKVFVYFANLPRKSHSLRINVRGSDAGRTVLVFWKDAGALLLITYITQSRIPDNRSTVSGRSVTIVAISVAQTPRV